jgi:hypothetical protein
VKRKLILFTPEARIEVWTSVDKVDVVLHVETDM